MFVQWWVELKKCLKITSINETRECRVEHFCKNRLIETTIIRFKTIRIKIVLFKFETIPIPGNGAFTPLLSTRLARRRTLGQAARSVGFGLPLGFISRPTSLTGEAHNLSLSISLSLSLSLSSSQNLTFVSFCESRGYFPRPKKNRPNSKFV